MKKTNINITTKSIIEAHGIHTNGNAKAIFCVEKGKAYTSMTDAALDLGCSIDSISNVVRGKQKTCKGYHVVLLSKANESLPMMAEQLSEMDILRAKANAYDKMMAEQEKIRKAEEKKAKELHEAEMAVLKYERKCKVADGNLTKYQAILDKNTVKLMEAQEKLRLLKGDDAVC